MNTSLIFLIKILKEENQENLTQRTQRSNYCSPLHRIYPQRTQLEKQKASPKEKLRLF
jgi:hypothetical protein